MGRLSILLSIGKPGFNFPKNHLATLLNVISFYMRDLLIKLSSLQHVHVICKKNTAMFKNTLDSAVRYMCANFNIFIETTCADDTRIIADCICHLYFQLNEVNLLQSNLLELWEIFDCSKFFCDFDCFPSWTLGNF